MSWAILQIWGKGPDSTTLLYGESPTPCKVPLKHVELQEYGGQLSTSKGGKYLAHNKEVKTLETCWDWMNVAFMQSNFLRFGKWFILHSKYLCNNFKCKLSFLK